MHRNAALGTTDDLTCDKPNARRHSSDLVWPCWVHELHSEAASFLTALEPNIKESHLWKWVLSEGKTSLNTWEGCTVITCDIMCDFTTKTANFLFAFHKWQGKLSGCNRHGYNSEAKLANQEPNMRPRSHQMQCRPWPCQKKRRFRELGLKTIMPFLLWSCTKMRYCKWCALTHWLVICSPFTQSKRLLLNQHVWTTRMSSKNKSKAWQVNSGCMACKCEHGNLGTVRPNLRASRWDDHCIRLCKASKTLRLCVDHGAAGKKSR